MTFIERLKENINEIKAPILIKFNALAIMIISFPFPKVKAKEFSFLLMSKILF